MTLENLAEPEWIQINCKDRLLTSTMCIVQERLTSRNLKITNEDKTQFCPHNYLIVNTNCYIFQWLPKANTTDINLLSQDIQAKSVMLNGIQHMSHIIHATVAHFPPIFSIYKLHKPYLRKFTYQVYLNVYRYQTDYIFSADAEGFHLCETEKIKLSKRDLGDNIFDCVNGPYISHFSLCDGIVDCLNNNWDENKLICMNSNDKGLKGNKRKELLISISDPCPSLFFLDRQGNCSRYIPLEDGISNKTIVKENNPFFKCNSGYNVGENLVDDLVGDCGPEAEDEPSLISFLLHNKRRQCRNQNELPCKVGHPKCFNISDACSYRLDQNGYNLPCRNGGHLDNCRNFNCNIKFKCVMSYCIPYSYVCDGKWDCPDGSDETSDNICLSNSNCSNMYKCRNSNRMCIHLGNVCDDITDCTQGDDELLCQLQNVKCPIMCRCLIYAIECKNENFVSNVFRYPYIYVSLSNIVNLPIRMFYRIFPNVRIGILASNNITILCGKHLPLSLVYLDKTYNNIKILKQFCLLEYKSLMILLLQNNQIETLQSKAFQGLDNLRVLTLSNNPFTVSPSNIFPIASSFKILKINVKYLRHIHKDTFYGVHISLICTNEYKICCLTNASSTCTATKLWHQSCFGILTNKSMIVIFFLNCFLILTLNISSIIFHIISRKTGKAFAINVIFINCNDLVYALYMAVIWIQSLSTKEVYALEDEFWRSSSVCFSLFTMVLWFSFSSQLHSLFLSISRYIVVAYPMASKFRNTNFVVKNLFALFSIVLLISKIITLLVQWKSDILPTSLCFPFFDPTRSSLILNIITWFLIICHLCSSVGTLLIHFLLVRNLKISQKKIKKTGTDDSNTLLFLQLAILTLSNFLCWIPADTIYVVTMYLPKYPMEFIMWTSGVILPINSIIYPLIFSVLCIRKIIKAKVNIGAAAKR